MNEFTARDLFAGLAMIGTLSQNHVLTDDALAKIAYDIADAMLLEKEKRDADQSIGS